MSNNKSFHVPMFLFLEGIAQALYIGQIAMSLTHCKQIFSNIIVKNQLWFHVVYTGQKIELNDLLILLNLPKSPSEFS